MSDERLRLTDLQPDPANAREHTERNVGMIETALREVGAARSIVVDETNTVLAGNATIEAAAAVGIERVRVVDADGDELVAVRRRNLTPQQKTRLGLLDNRSAELAGWNREVIGALGDDDIRGLWFDNELAGILIPPDAPPPDPIAEWERAQGPDYESADLRGFRILKVHFPDQAAVDEFARRIGQDISAKAQYVWFPPRPPETNLNDRWVAAPDGEPTPT